MELFHLSRLEVLFLSINIKSLPADHAFRTGTACDEVDDFHHKRRIDTLLLCHNLKSLGQKTITSKNSHGLTKNLVVCKAPPPVIIIVHFREVVMNQE